MSPVKPFSPRRATPAVAAPGVSARDAGPLRLDDAERAHVLRVLDRCGGSPNEAARLLGIGRTTLWRKLRRWGVEPRPVQ